MPNTIEISWDASENKHKTTFPEYIIIILPKTDFNLTKVSRIYDRNKKKSKA